MKIRLHGLKKDIDNFTKFLKDNEQVDIYSESDYYNDRGVSQYLRRYYDIALKEKDNILDELDKKKICPFFVGAGNQLYGVENKEDIHTVMFELEEIQGLTDLPVYQIEKMTKGYILLKKMEEEDL